MSLDNTLEQLVTIFDRAKHEALAVAHSLTRPNSQLLQPVPEWMTAVQLAEYWQLLNKAGEPTTAGIMKWAKRQPDEFPLPHAYMGDLLRFKREDANRWAVEEADRRRAQASRKKFRAAS